MTRKYYSYHDAGEILKLEYFAVAQQVKRGQLSGGKGLVNADELFNRAVQNSKGGEKRLAHFLRKIEVSLLTDEQRADEVIAQVPVFFWIKLYFISKHYGERIADDCAKAAAVYWWLANETDKYTAEHYGYSGVGALKVGVLTRMKQLGWHNCGAEYYSNVLRKLKPFQGLEFFIPKDLMMNAEAMNIPACWVAAIETLPSGKLGSQNTRKISDIVEDVIIELLGMHTAMNCQQVSDLANAFFEKNGIKCKGKIANISRQSVSLIKNDPQKRRYFISTREGVASWNKEFSPMIHGERPTFPLALVGIDGYTVELYYQEEGKQWQRLVMVMVIDCFNDYPLGYAIGEQENYELIEEAMGNALHHIKELTGEYYSFFQVQADNFAKKMAHALYKQLSKYEYTGKGASKQSRYIESFFSRFTKRSQTQPNFAGGGITSGLQVNMEYMRLVAKEFPDRTTVIGQIAALVSDIRTDEVSVDKETGEILTRKSQWLYAFNALPDQRKNALDRSTYLLLFGKEHQWTNTFSAKGIQFSLAPKAAYAIWQEVTSELIGLEYRVIYDERDLSSIIVRNETTGTHWHLPDQNKFPRAIADWKDKEGLRTAFNKIIEYRKEQQVRVIENKKQRSERVNKTDAEGFLKSALAIKGENKALLKEAEGSYKSWVHQEATVKNTLPPPQSNGQGGGQDEEEDDFELMKRVYQSML